VAQPFPIDGVIGQCVGGVDWVAKLDSSTFDIELNFVLLGERYSYFRCVINFIVPPPVSHAHIMDSKSEVNRADGNDLMFVKIRKFIDSPQRMKFDRRLTRIRLKRFDDLDRVRGMLAIFSLKLLLLGRGHSDSMGKAVSLFGLSVVSRASCHARLSNPERIVCANSPIRTPQYQG
jgi:hypothetical protein